MIFTIFCVLVEDKIKPNVPGDEYLLSIFNNTWVLSVHALMIFTIFCFLVDVKIKLKLLAGCIEITY
jgi:hypothetical protein